MSQPSTENLEEIRARLHEEIREARGILKDLRYEIRAARELAEATRGLVAELAEDKVAEHLQAEVTRQLATLGDQTREQMDKSTAKVIAEFDKLRNLLLGRERPANGRQQRSIPELLQDPAILAHARRAAARNAAKADRE